MRGFLSPALAALVLLLASATALAVERFPPPDFESGYTVPVTTTPPPRVNALQQVDVAVLIGTLALATFLVFHRRTRRSVIYLSIFSLIYFGFYRKGCVCAIGSIQNVSLAVFNSGYTIPIGVILYFVAPLAFALFFGRTFCAAVCPQGAIQDLVLVKPVQVPLWLEQGLRLIPYIYLSGAVLLAATGSAFIICQYDPFVGLFRLTGSRGMLILGGAFLVAGVFIGRPYCRFFCPYGALLGLFSRVSRWHVSITPDECIECRLCEESCPFGALHYPTPDSSIENRPVNRRRLGLLILLLPVLVLAGGWFGARLARPISSLHPTVGLAEQLVLSKTGPGEEVPDPVKAFRQTGQAEQELFEKALLLKNRLDLWGWVFGGVLGLVVGLKLIKLSVKRKREEYETDHSHCFACARCFETCPHEHLRRGTYSDLVPVEALYAASELYRQSLADGKASTGQEAGG